jgi:hypothetical protein
MWLIFTFHDKLWLPKTDKETVTFIAQISTVYSAMGCLCRINFLLKVGHVTCTHAGTWNNRYIVVTTLGTSEFSKCSLCNATQNMTLVTGVNLRMIFWVLSCTCSGCRKAQYCTYEDTNYYRAEKSHTLFKILPTANWDKCHAYLMFWFYILRFNRQTDKLI